MCGVIQCVVRKIFYLYCNSNQWLYFPLYCWTPQWAWQLWEGWTWCSQTVIYPWNLTSECSEGEGWNKQRGRLYGTM